MRTQDQFLKDIAKMKANVYIHGKRIGRDNPAVVNASAGVRMTFDLPNNPDFKGVATAQSHLNGKTINRFTHIHQNKDDLLAKQELTRKACNLAGGCIQRCMGCDMLNGISVTSKNCDIKYGTKYHENFLKYLAFYQENDIVASGAQTDSKGDRIKRPHQQWDPDQYLRVVERRPDGVVVCGCKQHNTMAPYADEIIVTPTRFMGKEEKDWAIAFALPGDTEGIHMICRESTSMPRDKNMASPYSILGDLESFTVFDHVFVPNERIFLNGETEFAGELALNFALYHRHSYTGCKPGIGDILTGLTALIAEYNNVRKEGHVKEKLAEMISVAELVYASGIAAAVTSTTAASGTQVPDVTYCNVGRRHAGHNVFHEYNILCDIAGGLSATLPLTTELNNPDIGHFIKKYITRKEGVAWEDIYRAYQLTNDLLAGENGTTLLIAGVHGGGSPIMEDIAIMGFYDLQSKIQIAKNLAGIKS